jgi:endonuclease YncB( thermonuclease family)
MNKYLQYFTCFFCKTNKEEEIMNENYKILNTIKDDKLIPYFSFKENTFYGKPCNIYDGDTFSIIFNYKGEFIKYRCRCLGYDSPEMKPSLKNENRIHEKELALKAKERFIELISKHETKLIKIECFDFDKYGRLLVNVFNLVDKESVNDIMVKEGFGKLYDGGKKDTDW